ncbi:hypothetical protein BDA96_05G089500 [Sorghum bicolor]|jgi:hypothetical protein|uniref:Uncharacterized protein n=2 Tax=Sorghum bicolor TaxID=4558 RepID=A0A921UFS0_SORBI|nr:hypothetical protein BDA96_05G089500 [Sorghum bicolor]OQU83162.1 hypothetical protein SORBI_3005G086650 [Sorghum bicolor]
MYPAPDSCIYRAWLVSKAQIGRLLLASIHCTHAIASVHMQTCSKLTTLVAQFYMALFVLDRACTATEQVLHGREETLHTTVNEFIIKSCATDARPSIEYLTRTVDLIYTDSNSWHQ